MIKVESLVKTYPGTRRNPPVRAVDKVSFQVAPGQLVGLLGPNGAGKTTTVKILCGLIRPDQGRVVINGADLVLERRRVLASLSAVLEGNRNIYWRLTAQENLEFFAALKGLNPKALNSAIDQYIELFGLQAKLNVEARQLSRGMQQKLAIAVALISRSEVVLLDEPTLGLDVQASYEIRQLLKKIAAEEGRTIVLTTHDMNVVEDTCERVIIINQGRVLADDLTKNLMELLQVRVYRIGIKGSLTPQQRVSLLAMPEVVIEEESPQKTMLSVRLEEPLVLYKVLDVFRESAAFIESIDHEQNNFERIFLEILEGRISGA